MIKIKPALLIALGVIVNLTSHLTSARAQLNPSIQAACEQLPTPPPQGNPCGKGPAGGRVSDPPPQGNPPGRLPAGTDVSDPPPQGNPTGKEPAGTRGGCEKTDKPFTPLLPVTKSGFSGSTLSGHPTFWFYVPYKTESISAGKFMLEDLDENPVYQTDLKLPKTPGFVSVSIPTTEKPLEKNKQYRWTFQLNCASPDSNKPNFVAHKGLVQRVDMPALEAQLKTATLEERINLYVKNSILYDASTDLAQIHSLPLAWRNLLRAIDLEQLEREPVAGSVVPSEE